MKKLNSNSVDKILWLSGTLVVTALVVICAVAHHLSLWATVPLPAPPLRIISDRAPAPQLTVIEPVVPVTNEVQKIPPSYELAKEATEISTKHYDTMVEAARQTDVDWQILISLFSTESSNGVDLGSHDPQSVMSDEQYQAFLEICREIGRDPSSIKVGGCGELGPFQFMPTTWQFIGTDADGDGIKNPFSVEDASVSAGKYLIYRGYKDSPEKAVRRYKGGTKGEPLADRVVGKTMSLALAMGMAS